MCHGMFSSVILTLPRYQLIFWESNQNWAVMGRSKEEFCLLYLINQSIIASSKQSQKLFAFLRRHFYSPRNELVPHWQDQETNTYRSGSLGCCVTHSIIAAENTFWWTTCQVRILLGECLESRYFSRDKLQCDLWNENEKMIISSCSNSGNILVGLWIFTSVNKKLIWLK